MDKGLVFEHEWIKCWKVVIDEEKAVTQCRVMSWLNIYDDTGNGEGAAAGNRVQLGSGEKVAQGHILLEMAFVT